MYIYIYIYIEKLTTEYGYISFFFYVFLSYFCTKCLTLTCSSHVMMA